MGRLATLVLTALCCGCDDCEKHGSSRSMSPGEYAWLEQRIERDFAASGVSGERFVRGKVIVRADGEPVPAGALLAAAARGLVRAGCAEVEAAEASSLVIHGEIGVTSLEEGRSFEKRYVIELAVAAPDHVVRYAERYVVVNGGSR